MYELSTELRNAIESIFENPEEGLIALGGIELDGFEKEKPLSDSHDPRDRVSLLKRKIENWVELYGLEIQEYDSEYDSLRLASEARAMLLVLRELALFFPEVEVAPRK